MKLKICFRLDDNDNLFPIQFTRSIAARLRALFAEVLLTIVGCGVDEVVEADALLEGVRVVIVRLKTNQKKTLFLPKTSIPKQPYRNYSGSVKFCAPKV